MMLGSPGRRELADTLFGLGAVKFGAFKLKLHEKHPEAPLSPVFMNLRTPGNPKPGPLTPEVVRMIGTEMHQLAREQHCTFSYVAGVPRAGDPFAEALREEMGMPPCSRLALEKEEGPDGRRIARVRSTGFEPGVTVLLVDDLITGADSKLEAIEALRVAEFGVKDIVVLVDREQGGRELIEKAGRRLHAVFKITELLDFYVACGYVDAAKRDEVRAYVEANRVAA